MWCVGEIRTIVERYQERYNGASGAQRQTLAEDVAQVLLQHVDKIGQPALLEKIRSDLPAKCLNWWKNNMKAIRNVKGNNTETEPTNALVDDEDDEGEELGTGSGSAKTSKKNYMKRWTVRTVAQKIHRPQFEQLLAKYQVEFADVLQATNPATNDLMGSLTAEQVNHCRELAVKFNKGEVPQDVQVSLANTTALSTTQKFLNDMLRTMGVNAVVFLAYKTAEGSIDSARLETPGTGFIGNPSYSEVLNEDYAAFMDHMARKTQARPKPENRWCMLENVPGLNYPRLPARDDDNKDHGLEATKTVIRNFVNKVYSACQLEGPVPWVTIGKEVANHINAQFLPPAELGADWSDPSRMSKAEVLAFFDHWYKRQQNSQLPLWFKKSGKTQPDYRLPEDGEDVPDSINYYGTSDDEDMVMTKTGLVRKRKDGGEVSSSKTKQKAPIAAAPLEKGQEASKAWQKPKHRTKATIEMQIDMQNPSLVIETQTDAQDFPATGAQAVVQDSPAIDLEALADRLRCLCEEPCWKLFIDSVLLVAKRKTRAAEWSPLAEFPSWAVYTKAVGPWTKKLPVEFYANNRSSNDAFSKVIDWLSKKPHISLDGKILGDSCRVASVALGAGLVLRDLHSLNFPHDPEDDALEHGLGYVSHTTLGFQDYEKVIEVVKGCLLNWEDNYNDTQTSTNVLKRSAPSNEESLVNDHSISALEEPSERITKRPRSTRNTKAGEESDRPTLKSLHDSTCKSPQQIKAMVDKWGGLALSIDKSKLPSAIATIVCKMDLSRGTVQRLGGRWYDILQKWVKIESSMGRLNSTKKGGKKKEETVAQDTTLFDSILPPSAIAWREQLRATRLTAASDKDFKSKKFATAFSYRWCQLAIGAAVADGRHLALPFWSNDFPGPLVTLIHCFTSWALGILERETRAEAKQWDACVEEFEAALDARLISA